MIWLYTGDLYESKPIEDARIQKILKKLQPGYGKLAFGDEDHAHAEEVTNILNEGGFEVLNNSARTIHYRNSSFTLYGQSINSQEEIPASDGFVLTLSHYPDSFNQNKLLRSRTTASSSMKTPSHSPDLRNEFYQALRSMVAGCGGGRACS